MENIKIIEDLPVERWEEYKNLKIEAIKDSPVAFSHELDDAINENDEYWKNGIGVDSLKIFAEDGGKLVGFANGRIMKNKMSKHNAFIDSFYVNKNYRGKGLGLLLETKLIEKISKNPEIVNILCEVSSTQEASIAIQKKLGFEISGITKNFIFYDGKYIDDIGFIKKIR